MHWSTSYARLKGANVSSTLQLLQAPLQSRFPRRFVYNSGGLSLDSDSTHKVSEADKATGYDQTKHVCERLVAAAAARSPSHQRGRVSTVKPALIVGDVENGGANADDVLWRVVMASVKRGARPKEEMKSWLAVSDVRWLSELIVHQSCAVEDFVQVTRGMPLEAFWAAMEGRLQVSLKSLPLGRWIEAAGMDVVKERERHPLWPVQQFLGSVGSERPSREEECDFGVISELEAVIHGNVKYLEDMGLIGTWASDGWYGKGKMITGQEACNRRRVLAGPSRGDW